eukprot:Nk52_evm21s2133 gene=Nk52_evmTU21s2133
MFTLCVEVVVTIGAILKECALASHRWAFPVRKNVAGEIVLITGGASGIGRLMALEFAKKGSILVIVDIQEEAMKSVAFEIQAIGAKCSWYVCDLSDRNSIYATADKIKQNVGDVDILINNAGIVTGKTLLDCPDALIQKTFEVNTIAHFWTIKAFLPSMFERNHGHIVTISSSAGKVGVCGLADYCASKFAAFGIDESLRFEFQKCGKTGIKTTCVCPYFINTGMFDGVKTRFPALMPILEPEYAVDKIIEAIETDQEVLIMPRFNYLCDLFRFMLPTRALDIAGQFLGVNSTMNDFKGRAKKVE